MSCYLSNIDYEASDEIDIDGIEFDLTWSDGDQSNNRFSSNFNENGNTVSFDWCFRFGEEQDWFELDMKILAEDEEVESNEFNIRVDRPEGANKSFK